MLLLVSVWFQLSTNLWRQDEALSEKCEVPALTAAPRVRDLQLLKVDHGSKRTQEIRWNHHGATSGKGDYKNCASHSSKTEWCECCAKNCRAVRKVQERPRGPRKAQRA